MVPIKKYFFTILLFLCLVLLLLNVQGPTVSAGDTISFAEGDWPGIRAKNAVITEIVNRIGYETETVYSSIPIIYEGLKQKNVDVFMGCWLPAQSNKVEAVEGHIEMVGVNMDQCINIMGVPEYVYEAGVKTHEDLAKHAEKFNREVYVGQNGWHASETFKKAIEKNTYNLGDWEAINSSQSALMAHVKQAIENDEWIVFAAWRPHWMNVILDFKFLKDPGEEMWKNPESEVYTLTTKDFKQENSQVYQFLKQVDIDVETGSEWIYQLGRKEKSPETMTDQWIRDNIETCREWLKGVKTPDGESAVEALEASLN